MPPLAATTAQARYPKGATTPDPLPEAASLLLDILRFALAVLVVVGHLTLPWFCSGWPPLLGYANIAVPAFFVLSGFMIRYVTTTREQEASRYWISRASRIVSVVVPACTLTVAADAVSSRANPALYLAVVGKPHWAAVPLHLLAHLSFLTQLWGHSVLLLSNLPLWSLGYEVPYYILFGLLTFLRGRVRVITVTTTALLYGPQILLLLPLWWSGGWLYDTWQWCQAKGSTTACSRGPKLTIRLACVFTLALLLTPVAGLTGFTRIVIAPNPLSLIHQGPARASMYEFAAGLLAWPIMFLALSASEWLHLRKGTSAAHTIRLVADSTFTLYLFHYPLLLLARSLALYRPDHTGDKITLLFAVVAISVAAAMPIDRFKRWLRRVLEQQVHHRRLQTKKTRYS